MPFIVNVIGTPFFPPFVVAPAAEGCHVHDAKGRFVGLMKLTFEVVLRSGWMELHAKEGPMLSWCLQKDEVFGRELAERIFAGVPILAVRAE